MFGVRILSYKFRYSDFFLRQAEQIALQRGKKQCYGAKCRVTLMTAFHGI